MRIDLLTSLSGVTFRQAWKGRVATRLGGLDVAVLGVRELVKNKRASGRPNDLADVALLEDSRGVPSRSRPRRAPRRPGPRVKRPPV